MVNGRIAQEMPTAELGRRPRAAGAAARRALRRRRRRRAARRRRAPTPSAAPTQVFTVRRAHGDGAPSLDDLAPRTVRGFTRWNAGGTAAPVADIARARAPPASSDVVAGITAPPAPQRATSAAQVFDFPVAASSAPRRLRRRHLRHQGPRARLPAPVPGKARPARRHRRPLDLRQAVARQRASARGRAPPSAGRVGGLQRRPRQRDHGDGARLRALPADAARPRRHASRPAAPAAPRWPRTACARCRSACPR